MQQYRFRPEAISNAKELFARGNEIFDMAADLPEKTQTSILHLIERVWRFMESKLFKQTNKQNFIDNNQKITGEENSGGP